MSKPYSINITNGKGSEQIVNGNYSVAASVSGYDNTSITPQTLNITAEQTEYTLKISATGTLTIHVSDGAGTNIQGATIIRCDEQGNQYGSVITTGEDGNAIFENVPYSADTTPLTIYFKQLTSDGNHDFSLELLNTVMTTQTYTYEITNTVPTVKTINLEDANYEGLPISTATITLS